MIVARVATAPAFLARIEPFHALPEAALTRVAADLVELHAEKDEVFFHEGGDADDVYVARSGRVRIQHFRANGSVRTVCMIGPGETFCCLPALDGGPYPATAVAAEPSVVYRLPGPVYRRLLESSAEFSRLALRKFCGRLREAGCEGCAQADDAGSRLAGKLLTLGQEFGDSIAVTRKELGEMDGTTVETAIRVTREFEDAGWITLARGRITLTDRPALSRRAQGPDTAP